MVTICKQHFQMHFFLNKNDCILIKLSVKFLPNGSSHNKTVLVHVMALCHKAISYYLNECWLNSMTLYGVPLNWKYGIVTMCLCVSIEQYKYNLSSHTISINIYNDSDSLILMVGILMLVICNHEVFYRHLVRLSAMNLSWSHATLSSVQWITSFHKMPP